MSVKDFIVRQVQRNDIKAFMENYHYSHNINGVISDYCFALFDKETLIGAMILGRLAMRNQWKKYADKEEDVIELRRLVCVDDTPKNTESYFIGHVLRWLRKNTKFKKVLSYSDLTHGHSGVVYKASNFKLVYTVPPIKVIRRLSDNKLYHDKTIRTKYKGELKPFALKLKQDLEKGEAVFEKTLGKNAYIYDLEVH